jgi:hypothetical protein
MKNHFPEKSRQHACIKTLESLFDDYNEGKLTADHEDFKNSTISYGRALQNMAIEAFDLLKELHKQEPCDATRAYLIFTGRILLRLSYIVNEKRNETETEKIEYFRNFMKGQL